MDTDDACVRRGRRPLRGYRTGRRKAAHRPLPAMVARLPVAGGDPVAAMERAFDFFDRVFGEGRYRRPEPGEGRRPAFRDLDLDDDIDF